MKKMEKKYMSLSEPVKASLFFTICSFVQKGIALLSTPIFTRLLSTSEYGNYTVYQSWYTIAVIFCTLHIEHGAFNTGIIKFEDNKEKFTASLVGLTSTLTVIFFGCAYLCKNFLGLFDDVSYFMIVAMFLQMIFTPSFSVWSANERFNFRYKKVVIFTSGYAILNPLLSIALIYFTKCGSDARIAGMVITQILVGGYFYIYLLKHGKCFFDKNFWKFSVLFCLPLIPHYLSETILQQADRLMIASYIGKSEAAIYAVAYTISMMVMYVGNAINQSFMPYLFQSIKSNKVDQIKPIQKGLLLIVFFTCIIAMAFAPEILKIFATSDYSEAIKAIPPIAISTLFIFTYNHFCYVEMYFEKNIFIMIASIIAALLNVILNAIFIPVFGFIAAGYTTLASYIVLCILHYVMYKRTVITNNIGSIYDGRFLALLSIISVLITVIMQLIYSYIIVRYLIIFITFIILYLMRNKIVKYIKMIKK